MSLIGYARVSTAEQDLSLQLDALRASGASRIFEDRGVSGAKTERPGLNAALSFLREGDTLVVWKMDRLGRSMTHLLQTVADLEKRSVGFRSLTENIDTTTPTGRLVFHIFGALGQFERDLIRERTNAGLAAAATRGRKGGRPAVATPERIARARQLIASGLTVREAAARVKIGKSALYTALKHDKDAAGEISRQLEGDQKRGHLSEGTRTHEKGGIREEVDAADHSGPTQGGRRTDHT